MSEKIFSAKLASTIVMNYYKKLETYTYSNMEDSDEYMELIDRIKDLVKVEEETYALLDIDEVQCNINEYNPNGALSELDRRIYMHLANQSRLLDNKAKINDTVLLSSVISSKLIIDVLKSIDKKINELYDNDNISYEEYNMLNLYNKIYRYNYLTMNNYIEKIALDNNFDLDKIQSINYYELEEKYNIKFIDLAQQSFIDFVNESMDQLYDIDVDDKYLLSYTTLFEISRIEAALPYMNKKSMTNVISYYMNNHLNHEENPSIREVKKIIKKRRKEFE